jgi:hypothetical protein
MKYLLMIYTAENEAGAIDQEDLEEIYAEYRKLTANLQASGGYLASERLQPTSTATTVRVRDGKTITMDGPFAETREQLGGFYLINAEHLDEAIAIAARIPAARVGSVEVRPIWSM